MAGPPDARPNDRPAMPRPLLPLFATAFVVAGLLTPAIPVTGSLAASAAVQDDPVAPAGAGAPAAPLAGENAAATSWAVISLGGERIGWARSVATPLDDDPSGEGPEAGVRTEVETSMTFLRFGQAIKMSVELVAEADDDGDLQSYTLVQKNPGAAPTRTDAKRDGNVLILTSTVNGKETVRQVPLPPHVKGPAYAETLLADGSLTEGTPVTYAAFFPELEKAGATTLLKGAAEAVTLPTGDTRTLTKVTVTHDVLPFATTLWVNEEGESVFDSTDMLGQTLTTYDRQQGGSAASGVRRQPRRGGHGLRHTGDGRSASPTCTAPRVDLRGDGRGRRRRGAVPERRVAVRSNRWRTARARITVRRLPIPREATAGDRPGPAQVDPLPAKRRRPGDRPCRTPPLPRTPPPGRWPLGCAAYVSETLTDKNFSTALASAAEVAENARRRLHRTQRAVRRDAAGPWDPGAGLRGAGDDPRPRPDGRTHVGRGAARRDGPTGEAAAFGSRWTRR